MESRLTGKLAIVTGAGQGIGKAVALRLAREGADCVVADINAETVGQVTQEIHVLGRRAQAYPMNVASLAEVESMVGQAVSEFGRIDILVNAAGIAQTKPFLEITEPEWDRVIDVNLKGTVLCMQAVARQMIRQVPQEVVAQGRADRSYGKIVNFSSISGRRGRSVQMAYAASKAAIISVTQSAALALSPYNVNVNAVCPGVIPTPMWEQIDRDRSRIMGAQPGDAIRAFIEKVPLQRPGSPEDVAAAVAFLCSADADYITGQTLNVDGGFEMN
ncbi:MAG: glucose 1-dehydrogenase [Sedimentisphaerales bacterium]|nr:glucose 1-dehydrogenase [Sedimentisphaerales bacterium]